MEQTARMEGVGSEAGAPSPLPAAPAAGSVILTTLQTSTSPNLIPEGVDGWPAWAPVDPCIPEYRVYFCACRSRVATVGCNRLDCRGCEAFLRKRRADAIEARMEAGRNGKPVLYTIFTVPPDRRKAAADPKTWGNWVRSLRKILKRDFGLLFGVERIDPAGDEHPSLWHPHLNLLWVQRDGFRPFIDVDALREAWARIIEAPVVDIWTQYSTAERQLRHWYSYMGRTWANWRNSSARKYLTVRWIGQHQDLPPDDDMICVCPKCGREVEVMSFGSKEVAEEKCRAGPAALIGEVEARRAADYKDAVERSFVA